MNYRISLFLIFSSETFSLLQRFLFRQSGTEKFFTDNANTIVYGPKLEYVNSTCDRLDDSRVFSLRVLKPFRIFLWGITFKQFLYSDVVFLPFDYLAFIFDEAANNKTIFQMVLVVRRSIVLTL